MIQIGKYLELEIIKEVDFGLYLDGGPYGEVLLPIRYVPKEYEIGKDLKVLLYTDSEDRIIATTLEPFAVADEFACLEVKAVMEFGAFLDWGLPKDLFVPFREQVHAMQVGEHYVVRVYVDEKTDRMIASGRLNRFVEIVAEGLEEGEKVDLLIAEKTEVGYKAIINEAYWGVIYHNEIFSELKIGERREGFVKKIREDGKVDLSLEEQGYQKQIPVAAKNLIQQIKENDNFLALTDKSPPEEIYQKLKMSKKAFKKAVGMLYKQRLIVLEKGGIRIK